jgi:hypothetical protein
MLSAAKHLMTGAKQPGLLGRCAPSENQMGAAGWVGVVPTQHYSAEKISTKKLR